MLDRNANKPLLVREQNDMHMCIHICLPVCKPLDLPIGTENIPIVFSADPSITSSLTDI